MQAYRSGCYRHDHRAISGKLEVVCVFDRMRGNVVSAWECVGSRWQMPRYARNALAREVVSM